MYMQIKDLRRSVGDRYANKGLSSAHVGALLAAPSTGDALGRFSLLRSPSNRFSASDPDPDPETSGFGIRDSELR
jgi:hypothetical protein